MGGMFDFTGRRVLVTGASRGLGLEIARAFADAGATVMLNGRDRAALDAACRSISSENVHALPGDLAVP